MSSQPTHESEVITIDLKPFVGPIANIISAMIIAGAILISGGINTGSSNSNSQNVAGADTTATGDIPAGTITTSIDDDAIKGDRSSAKVAIVEFSDFECPFCQRFYSQTLSQLESNYIDSGEVILVYRDLPLSFHNPAANLEANIAECIRKQGGDNAYYAMHDFLFDNSALNGAGLEMSKVVDFTNSLGLNGASVQSCAEAGEFNDEIAADSSAASSAGISGTPGFIVGTLADDGTVTGEVISGAQPYAVFQTAIEKYL